MNKLPLLLPLFAAMILIPMVNAVPGNCDGKNPNSMAYLLCKDQIYDSKISNMDSKMLGYDAKIAHLESIVMPNDILKAEAEFTSVMYDVKRNGVFVTGNVSVHNSFTNIDLIAYDGNSTQYRFINDIYAGQNLGMVEFILKVSILDSNIKSIKVQVVDTSGKNIIVLASTVVAISP